MSVWSIEAKGHRCRSPNWARSTLIRATNQILSGCPTPLLIRGRGPRTHTCTGIHTHTVSLCLWILFTVFSLFFYLPLLLLLLFLLASSKPQTGEKWHVCVRQRQLNVRQTRRQREKVCVDCINGCWLAWKAWRRSPLPPRLCLLALATLQTARLDIIFNNI